MKNKQKLLNQAINEAINDLANDFINRKQQINESSTDQVLPKCITHSLILAKKVAKRADFPEEMITSLSSAIRISLYNETLSAEDLIALLRIVEKLATSEVAVSKAEKQTLMDALETLGSMHKKVQQDIESQQQEV